MPWSVGAAAALDSPDADELENSEIQTGATGLGDELEEHAPALMAQLDVMREKFEASETGTADLAEWAYQMKAGAFRLVQGQSGQPCKTLKDFLCVWLRLPGDVTDTTLKRKRNHFDYLARQWSKRLPKPEGKVRPRGEAAGHFARMVAYLNRNFHKLPPDQRESLAQHVYDMCDWPRRNARNPEASATA